MNRKQKQAVIGTVIAAVIAIAVVIGVLVMVFTPSKERMELTEYYPSHEGELLLFMENSQYEKQGLYVDDVIYIDLETVQDYINHRFYWDSYEKILLYTTPTEVIKAPLGEESYTINKTEVKTNYPIVFEGESGVYVALEFVKEFSNVEYAVFTGPDRIVLKSNWGEEFLYSEAEEDTVVRYEASSKSPILADVATGERVTYLGEAEEKGYVKVMTSAGVIGYVKKNHLTESYYETLTNDYEYPEYTSITKEETINLVWHQVTSQAANNGLLELLENTKAVNVVSPTWFSIANDDGEITSLANANYVKQAHDNKLEVWALIDDFDSSLDKEKLFGRTSSREKLANEIMAQVIQYDIDGINIDFELISQASSDGYIQFLRELSIKCRNNGIVLSVDNYIPAPYNQFYNREEQGVIADYVVVMAYDEYYAGSPESGPVSSISYVENGLANTMKEVPVEKIIVALPFYTRLWKEDNTSGELVLSSEAYAMQRAATLMMNKGVELVWNDVLGLYYGEYIEDDATFKMWLEDERSYELKLQAVFSEDVAGVAAWKLGLETKAVWDVIEDYVVNN